MLEDDDAPSAEGHDSGDGKEDRNGEDSFTETEGANKDGEAHDTKDGDDPDFREGPLN